MNKQILILTIVGLVIIAIAIFNLYIDRALDPNHGILRGSRTCGDCHGKNGEKVGITPKDFNLSSNNINKDYGISFNNPTCKNGTGIIFDGYHYEKVDGIYQMTYNLTCLNEKITLIPQ